MRGKLVEAPVEAMIQCLVDHFASISIDAIDAAPLAIERGACPFAAAVTVEIPGRRLTMSADTGRRAAIRLSSINRNGAALGLMATCDQAEAVCARLEFQRRAA